MDTKIAGARIKNLTQEDITTLLDSLDVKTQNDIYNWLTIDFKAQLVAQKDELTTSATQLDIASKLSDPLANK